MKLTTKNLGGMNASKNAALAVAEESGRPRSAHPARKGGQLAQALNAGASAGVGYGPAHMDFRLRRWDAAHLHWSRDDAAPANRRTCTLPCLRCTRASSEMEKGGVSSAACTARGAGATTHHRPTWPSRPTSARQTRGSRRTHLCPTPSWIDLWGGQEAAITPQGAVKEGDPNQSI